jgi:hypothetical protein
VNLLPQGERSLEHGNQFGDFLPAVGFLCVLGVLGGERFFWSVMIDQLAEAVRKASAERRPLRIRGSGSKDFYAYALEGEPLDVRGHSGVVDYEPTELVITARTGTPLT